MALIRRQ